MQNFELYWILNLNCRIGKIPMINDSTRVTRIKPQWQLITFSLIALLKQSLKLPLLKVIYPIIFLFVFWFHRPQHKGKTKQLLFIKEYLTQNQLNHLRNLAKTIEASSIKFENLLEKCDSSQPESPLSVNELKVALFFT